jgi:hypothetical protein
LDGFRRVVSIEKGKKEETLSVAEVEYDLHGGKGKPKRRSIPHAPGAKAEWVECEYDSLGRVTKAGKSRFVRKGNSLLVMNAVGGWKKFIRGADRKLQKVVTPNPQSGPDLETTYRYNRKGKLMGVTMPRLDGTQKREFLSNADADEKVIEVDTQVKYWTGSADSLYYWYNVTYDGSGIATSSTDSDWKNHPSATADHKRPDSIWIPSIKTSISDFWDWQLNYTTIRAIVPAP